MKTQTLFLLALMLVAPLTAVIPVGAAPPDRPPVIVAGPDQTVNESADNCTAPDAGFGETCIHVAINTRYAAECGLSALTYDPDCQNLKFSFRATPFPCNPDPTTGSPGGGVPCIPIGDGSQFIDTTAAPFTGPGAAFISAQNCQRPANTLPGTAPDIRIVAGDPQDVFVDEPEEGFFSFQSPKLQPGQTTACIYSIDVLVSDSQTRPAQPAAPSAGVTDYTLAMDTIVITVNPVATDPLDVFADVLAFVCDTPYPNPNIQCVNRTGADIVDDHGKHILFQYGPIYDDRETRAVQLLLYVSETQSILVPLTSKIVTVPFQANPHQDEQSYWVGQVPVDTPALIVGTYLYHSRVYDGQGGVSIHEGGDDIELGEFEVTAALAPDDTLSYPCSLNGAPAQLGQGNAPCIQLSTSAAAVFTPNNCFPGFTREPPHALGTGETLRPQVFWAFPVTELPVAPIFDHNLMGWKFTYQSCIRSTNGDGTVSFLAQGPEVELRAPYFMSLDTLFDGEQEVALRAYDRIGTAIAPVVIPIVEDRSKPVFVTDIHDVNYEGLPFQMVVYVHDDIGTAVTLHIDAFNRTAAGKAVHHDALIVANQLAYDGNGWEITLPRLGDMVPFDIFGTQDLGTTCDYLYDQNGDGLLDRAYSPATRTMIELISVEGATGTIDVVVDLNANGEADVGEKLLVGDPTTIIRNANQCIDPFSDQPHLQWFLSDAPTQVFVFNLTRFRLGDANYQFTIQDVVFNRFADPSYEFSYAGETSPTSYLAGTFETRHAVVDAMVESISVSAGPFLAGDKVSVTVLAKQESRLVPAVDPADAPIVPLQLLLSLPGSGECRNPASSDLRQCLRICPSSTNVGCTGVPTATGVTYTNVFTRPLVGINAATIDPYGIVPEYAPPEVVAIALSAYPAGKHTLHAEVLIPDSVDDDDLANNFKTETLEIYLGQIVVGAYPANSVPQGRVFYIRAERGSAQIQNGAVEIDASGALVEYDLQLNQVGAPRYEFTYQNEEGEDQVAYWEPQTRYSRVYGKDCSALTDAEKLVDARATPPKDPQCRAITVITPAVATEPEKSTPGFEPIVALLALAMLAFLRRRK